MSLQKTWNLATGKLLVESTNLLELYNEKIPPPPTQVERHYILKDLKSDQKTMIRKNYISYPVPPKVKELLFKILNEMYPTTDFIRHGFFCDSELENLDRLLFQCETVQLLWNDNAKRIDLPPLTRRIITFGFFSLDSNIGFLINNLLLRGKFYIHKCRFIKTKHNLN